MFFHATLTKDRAGGKATSWRDLSTATHFVFESPSGSLRLLRRSAYPATYAYAEGPVLRAGYGDESLARLADVDNRGPLYSQEFLHIELDCDKNTASIQRDYFCTVPLFAAYDQSLLSIANLFETACSPMTGLRLDKAKLHRFFTDSHVGRADTYIKNCLSIGALEQVTWESGDFQHEAHAFSDFVPEAISPETAYTDPSAFRQFFDELMKEYAERYADKPVACELSGGIDSAIVAGYLADNGHDPLLLTVGFPSSFKETQAVKIDDFKRRFHTRHRVTDLDDPRAFPLSRMALDGSWHPFYQDEEIYYEAFQTHARHLAEHGIGVSFNGLGGDDVLARFDFSERQKDLPGFFTDTLAGAKRQETASNDSFARVAGQFVMQKVSCNNVYLELGIWPVAPFTDPRLFLYCQSLQPRFRDNKNIYRMYCQAWGYPESVYHPSTNEDFGPFFKSYANGYLPTLAEQWLEASVLSELGLIDKALALDYAKNASTDEELFQTYRLVTTEINLQALGIRRAA